MRGRVSRTETHAWLRGGGLLRKLVRLGVRAVLGQPQHVQQRPLWQSARPVTVKGQGASKRVRYRRVPRIQRTSTLEDSVPRGPEAGLASGLQIGLPPRSPREPTHRRLSDSDRLTDCLWRLPLCAAGVPQMKCCRMQARKTIWAMLVKHRRNAILRAGECNYMGITCDQSS